MVLFSLDTNKGREFTMTGYPERDVHRTAVELRRMGYLLGTGCWSPFQLTLTDIDYEQIIPRRLTKKGEDLAQAIESDWVWTQVKRWLPRPEDRVSLIAIEKVAEKVNRMRN